MPEDTAASAEAEAVYYVTGPKPLVDCVPTKGGSFETKSYGERINVRPEDVERWAAKGLIATEKPEAN